MAYPYLVSLGDAHKEVLPVQILQRARCVFRPDRDRVVMGRRTTNHTSVVVIVQRILEVVGVKGPLGWPRWRLGRIVQHSSRRIEPARHRLSRCALQRGGGGRELSCAFLHFCTVLAIFALAYMLSWRVGWVRGDYPTLFLKSFPALHLFGEYLLQYANQLIIRSRGSRNMVTYTCWGSGEGEGEGEG